MRSKLLFYYLSEFLLSIIFLSLFLIALLEVTVLRPKYAISQLEKNNYYDTLYKSINNEMSNYIIQSGLDESVLKEIYTKDMVKKDVIELIYRFYGSGKITVNTIKIEKKLESNINNYLLNNNIEITDQEALNRFIEQMLDVYEKKIVLSKSLTKVQNIVVKWDFNLKIVFGVLALLACFICILVNWICKKRVLAIPLFTSGILLLLGNYLLTERIDIAHILFWNENVSRVMKNILWNLSNTVWFSAIILIILAILSCLIFKRNSDNKTN